MMDMDLRGMTLEEYSERLSPELAYKFLMEQLTHYPEAEQALKKACLLPNVTPDVLADLFESWSKKQGMPFPPGARIFILRALEHFQFLAQVEAGTYKGE